MWKEFKQHRNIQIGTAITTIPTIAVVATGTQADNTIALFVISAWIIGIVLIILPTKTKAT